METYVPMTIADAHNFSAVMMQSIILVLSAEFTVVFAYLAGLYYFVSKSRLPLRLFAHGFVIFMIVFFWVMLTIEFAVIESYLEHRDYALEAGTIVRETDPSAARTAARGPLVGVLIGSAHLAQVITIGALTYIAFFFDWSNPEGAK